MRDGNGEEVCWPPSSSRQSSGPGAAPWSCLHACEWAWGLAEERGGRLGHHPRPGKAESPDSLIPGRLAAAARRQLGRSKNKTQFQCLPVRSQGGLRVCGCAHVGSGLRSRPSYTSLPNHLRAPALDQAAVWRDRGGSWGEVRVCEFLSLRSSWFKFNLLQGAHR